MDERISSKQQTCLCNEWKAPSVRQSMFISDDWMFKQISEATDVTTVPLLIFAKHAVDITGHVHCRAMVSVDINISLDITPTSRLFKIVVRRLMQRVKFPTYYERVDAMRAGIDVLLLSKSMIK